MDCVTPSNPAGVERRYGVPPGEPTTCTSKATFLLWLRTQPQNYDLQHTSWFVVTVVTRFTAKKTLNLISEQ